MSGGIVCKLFIQTRTQSPDGTFMYDLGAVCRGETNKDWSAATPSGNLKHKANDVLDEVWNAKVNGEAIYPEVLVYVLPHPEGDWAFESCAFTYGGCQVGFRQKSQPWGALNLAINASAATKSLREQYAQSLINGEVARFVLDFTAATEG